MRVAVQEIIRSAHLEGALYAGKRAVRDLVQPGTFKSHSVVCDWRDPSLLRIDVKAGLGGRDLPARDLAAYPVSLQSATFFEIEVDDVTRRAKDDADEGETDDRKGRGSSGGGGGLKKKKDDRLMRRHFDDEVEGKIPEDGQLKRAVVMGMEIARNAFDTVFGAFMQQLQHAKIAASDLLAKAGNVTKFTPPAFMQARGDETASYKYDRVKNEAMFQGPIPTM